MFTAKLIPPMMSEIGAVSKPRDGTGQDGQSMKTEIEAVRCPVSGNAFSRRGGTRTRFRGEKEVGKVIQCCNAEYRDHHTYRYRVNGGQRDERVDKCVEEYNKQLIVPASKRSDSLKGAYSQRDGGDHKPKQYSRHCRCSCEEAVPSCDIIRQCSVTLRSGCWPRSHSSPPPTSSGVRFDASAISLLFKRTTP